MTPRRFTSTADLEAWFDTDFGGHEPSYNRPPGKPLPVITDGEPAAATRMK